MTKASRASGSRNNETGQGVTVLGATGSIGLNTLDVLARHGDRFRVVALTAHTREEKLFEQCLRFRPRYAVVSDAGAAGPFSQRIRAQGLDTEVLSGPEGLERVAALIEVRIVVAGIVGAAGLMPALAAVRAGKRVLFANKEPLVMCGRLFIETARTSGAELMPVDSEHNAIFQCMPTGFRTGETRRDVRRILLTCSGGPFRTTPQDKLAAVTPEQAVAHPNWVMGRKISVDSATLMNKGLELIEACRLFGVSPDKIEIVIHPQSVIHSMVEYTDGSVLAQLGNPDMRTPIAHALAWPERIESGVGGLDFQQLTRLDFSAPDTARFPCLRLATEAARTGGTAPAVLNAANEVAVQAFLDREIGFTDIPHVIEHTLGAVPIRSDEMLDDILAGDAAARGHARMLVERQPPRTRQGVQ
jgi:1-deoxy-D-xylulose-5-phosphate reductoisomerase